MGQNKAWEKIIRDRGLLSSEPFGVVSSKYKCDACKDTRTTGEIEGDCPAGRWNYVPCPSCKPKSAKANSAVIFKPKAVVLVDNWNMSAVLTYCIPIKIESEANLREHWAVRKKRWDKQETAICKAIGSQHRGFIGCMVAWRAEGDNRRFVVKLTRVGKRFLDGDNLQGGFKRVRDSVADELKINDGKDSECTWHYYQEIGKEYSCRIEIRTEEY